MGRRPLLLAILVGAESLAGCSLIPGSSLAGLSPSAKPEAPEPMTPSTTPPPTVAASPAPSATATATATDGVLADWGLEEKVGQLMVVGVDVQTSEQSSNEAVDTHHVGNIFTARRITASGQATQKVIDSFTPKIGPGTTHVTPVLVATDQEGGEAQVLTRSGFSDTPSVLGQLAQSRSQLAASARTWGKGLVDVDVNMDLTSIADLVDTTRPISNEPIGRRGWEYGHDTATISSQAGVSVEGMQASKVIPTYKHLPGLGRVKDDTDTSAGVVDSTTTHSADAAVSVIFSVTIAAGAPVIMVSSAMCSLIDPSTPAVSSSMIITDMLCREMDFSRVVITDDVSAAVQIQDVNVGDRAMQVIRAGYDIVLASVDPTVVTDMVKALISIARPDLASTAWADELTMQVLNLKKSLQS